MSTSPVVPTAAFELLRHMGFIDSQARPPDSSFDMFIMMLSCGQVPGLTIEDGDYEVCLDDALVKVGTSKLNLFHFCHNK